MRCMILVLSTLLAGCGPSCEERGGHQVYTGTTLMPMMVGKVTILQPRAQYKCVGDTP